MNNWTGWRGTAAARARAGVAWSLTATYVHQSNLLLTSLFLTVINSLACGSKARGRKQQGLVQGQHASNAPALFSTSTVVGANVIDASGEKFGDVIDLMLRRAIEPARIEFRDGFAQSKMSRALQGDD